MYTAGSVNAISILAPTRGATYIRRTGDHIRCNFNPRSHEGSDANGCRRISDYGAFQSSLPRGERPSEVGSKHLYHNFNPRSHEGSDVEQYKKYAALMEFQSSLPRGERRVTMAILTGTNTISILAPTRGATRSTGRLSTVLCISILAPTRGATRRN